jgi:hypothetical protein
MADIRAPQWPAVRTPTPAAPKADARAQAQRAFFQAALTGKTEDAPRAPAAKAPDLRVQMPAEEPQKILRPGSFVDIRV